MASESVPILLDKDLEDSEETKLLGGQRRVPEYSRSSNINFFFIKCIFFSKEKMHVFCANTNNICSPLKYDRA